MLLLLLSFYFVSASNYDNHRVIRAIPREDEHLGVLRSIENHGSFWKEPTRVNSFVDIQVSPQNFEKTSEQLKKANIDYNVFISNLQKIIEKERNSLDARNTTLDKFSLDSYHSYDEIMNWLDQIVSLCQDCSSEVIGKSYEGRNLKMIKIADDLKKPVIWIDAGIHAREWIAPATAIYVINTLVKKRTDSDVYRMIKDFAWHILPLANPDGYAYTWTTDRMWRKTRSKNKNKSCRGVDPNRNFDFHWRGPGTSRYPCSESYGGTKPFSESESAAISSTVWRERKRIKAYFTLHSYGQYWLTPWGFTYAVPKDYDDMMNLANLSAKQLEKINGTKYEIGASSALLYLASGGADDWAKAMAGIKYSFTIELGDTGKHGFILPAKHD